MVGDHMPHLCPQSRSHALPRPYYGRPSHSWLYSGLGKGMRAALGAQVGHVVTNHASPEGCLISTVFTKKCQKWNKKGVPPILTTFGEGFTLLGTPPHPRRGSRIAKMAPHFHFPVPFSALRDEISGWGVQRG